MVTRRQLIAAGVSSTALGALGVGAWLEHEQDTDQNRDKANNASRRAINSQNKNGEQDRRLDKFEDAHSDGDGPVVIDGYEEESDLRQHKRIVKQKEDFLSGLDYGQIDTTAADILGSGDELRVKRSGDVTAHSDDPKAILEGEVMEDPEYILSTEREGTFNTFTDKNHNGKIEEADFTDFGGSQLDVDAALSELDSYSIINADKKAARKAVNNLSGLQVFASTDLISEQPNAAPVALRNLKAELDQTATDIDELYHLVKDEGAEVDQYETVLSSSLSEAREDAQIAGRDVKLEGQAQKLLKYTESVNEDYKQMTQTMAQDLGRVVAMKDVVDRALDQAEYIAENAEGPVSNESEDRDQRDRGTPDGSDWLDYHELPGCDQERLEAAYDQGEFPVDPANAQYREDGGHWDWESPGNSGEIEACNL